MTEHRQHPRAPIELEVAYRRLNSFFVDYTRNVSKGGMFVRTTRLLPLGTRFLFQLKIPGRAEALDLIGEIVHAQAEGDDPGLGLRFVWSDESARTAFESVVEQLMADSLGAHVATELLERKTAQD
jgi:type IV pilus assembly protein PilZ